MRGIAGTAWMFVLVSAVMTLTRGQEVGAYVAFGGTYDSSTGARIDTFGDGTLHKTPALLGVFGHVGADVFFTKRLAVAGEISWRPAEGDYAGISYRPTFYTMDVLYRPLFRHGRWEPELRAGIGGMRMHFFPNDDASCAQVAGCPASDHFQEHLAAAGRWYFSSHFFLRPAVDVHHVHGLFEFGHTWVPEYSVGVGYSLGRGE